MPRRLQGTLLTCPVGTVLQVYRVRFLVLRLTCAPCLTCSARFLGPHRAGLPGLLVLVGSDCQSRRRAVSRGSVHPRSQTWVGVRSSVWLDLPVEEPGQSWKQGLSIGELGQSRKQGLPVGEAGQSRKRALFLLSQAFRLVRRIALLACRSGSHRPA